MIVLCLLKFNDRDHISALASNQPAGSGCVPKAISR
jgi:hypothetical protein